MASKARRHRIKDSLLGKLHLPWLRRDKAANAPVVVVETVPITHREDRSPKRLSFPALSLSKDTRASRSSSSRRYVRQALKTMHPTSIDVSKADCTNRRRLLKKRPWAVSQTQDDSSERLVPIANRSVWSASRGWYLPPERSPLHPCSMMARKPTGDQVRLPPSNSSIRRQSIRSSSSDPLNQKWQADRLQEDTIASPEYIGTTTVLDYDLVSDLLYQRLQDSGRHRILRKPEMYDMREARRRSVGTIDLLPTRIPEVQEGSNQKILHHHMRRGLGLNKPLPTLPDECHYQFQSKRGGSLPVRCLARPDHVTTYQTSFQRTWAPAVTHETRRQNIYELREEHITREDHHYHEHLRTLPVMDVQILPVKHLVLSGDLYVEVPPESIPQHTRNFIDSEVAKKISESYIDIHEREILTLGLGVREEDVQLSRSSEL